MSTEPTEQIDDLRRVQIIETGLASEFWRLILKPLLTDRLTAATTAIRNPSLTRKHNLPDDYLRGISDLAETLLSQPRLIAETVRQAAVEEKMAYDRDVRDSVIAHYGRGSMIEDDDSLET